MNGILGSIAGLAADALSGLLPARAPGEAAQPAGQEAAQGGGFAAMPAAALGTAAPTPAPAGAGEGAVAADVEGGLEGGEGKEGADGARPGSTSKGSAVAEPAVRPRIDAAGWSGSHGLRAADLAGPTVPAGAKTATGTTESAASRVGTELKGGAVVSPGVAESPVDAGSRVEGSDARPGEVVPAPAAIPASTRPADASAKPAKGDAAIPEESGPAGEARRGDRPRRVRGGDPDRVNRDADLLDPEFRARMERVVERMRNEFGHEVRVTETFREQARQEHLYAQGRTRSGPVVTWTRSSNHTRGRAADVVIDGTYDNPAGYARLARVAREEGLRTLGARDPGHLELPRGAGTSGFDPSLAVAADDVLSAEAVATAPRRATTVPQAAPAPMPGVARVAEVAEVARVAQVAAVARVATPGGGAQTDRALASGARGHRSESRLDRAEVTEVSVAPAASRGEPSAPMLPVRPAAEVVADPRRPAREDLPAREAKEATAAAEVPASAESEPSALRPAAPARESFPAAPAGSAAPVHGADAASRVAQVLEIRDGAPARPLSSITLRLDDGQGGEDRIRVDLRGSSVDATLDVNGAREAERLNARVGELHQALERQGLETESVRIRSAHAAEAVDAARTAAALREGDAQRTAAAARADTSSTPQRDRSGSTPHDEPHRGSDDPRQRSRRERKGGSQP